MLHKRRSRLDIKKKVFTERVVKPLNRLPREVVELPYLEMFRNQAGGVFRDMV